MTIIDTVDIRKFNTTPLEETETGRSSPRVLTIAGSDSSGGAGIEADLKTITAHKCYGLTCINSLTAQNTTGVFDTFEIPYDFLIKLLDANFEDITIDAIKTGMLTEDGIKALIDSIEKYKFKGHLVIDPVMISTSGFVLSKQANLKLVIDKLFSKASLITPNFFEAVSILTLVDDEFENEQKLVEHYQNLNISNHLQIIDLCKKIVQKTDVKNVLIKGGHVKYAKNDELFDVLYESQTDTATVFQSHFQKSKSTHGTGCTLSSSIASNLAKNLSLVDSVGNGIIYVQHGIEAADPQIGSGHGPLCHFEAHQPLSFQQISGAENVTDLVDFLKNHPFVQKDWYNYTHHPFVEKLSKLELPIESFFGFLKQDHAYLLNYAKTHCLAAAIAPNTQEITKEVDILQNVLTEMGKHKEKCLKLGISEQELDNVKMNELCKLYSDYLLKIAKHGTWLEINIALAACLFGYRDAAIYGSTLYVRGEQPSLKDTLYKEWLDDYTSDWYHQLCLEGEQVIRKCVFGPHDLSHLLEIFGNTVKLEVAFWDAFV